MPVLIGRLKEGRMAFSQVWDSVSKDGFSPVFQDRTARKPTTLLRPGEEHLARTLTAAARDEKEAKYLIEKYRDQFDYLEVEPTPVLPVYTGDMGKYGEPYEPPAAIAPSSIYTPDFKHLQKYLNDPPEGIGLNWLLSRLPNRPGMRGENVRIVDIEGNWDNQHEDLLEYNGGILAGTPITGDVWFNHGTAVLGILGADDNRGGTYGLAPAATVYQISQTYGVASSIRLAADRLSLGDIILLEMQFYPPPGYIYQYVPTEFYSYFFDAIKYATDRGIIVIEAGANGSAWLDDPVFNGIFDRNVRDSGAILVGACSIDSPHWSLQFSSYGNRMDVRAPGEYVATCGYGDYYRGPSVPHQDYTYAFGGTSSASPIACCCALVNSCRKAQGLPLLNSIQMRDLMVSTGTPQSNPWYLVGKFPNLIEMLKYGSPIPDMNLSGKCDFEDLWLFSDLYGKNDRRADFNWSGVVDMEDYAIFSRKFAEDNPA